MTIDAAIDLVLADHELNARSDLIHTRSRAAHLRRLLPLREPVTLIVLMAYAKERARLGASPATINRELALLRRGCNLLGMTWPANWRQLREAAPRTGFCTPEELDRVCAQLPLAYGDGARFCYLTGWRRGEMLALRWSEVDFGAGEVRLLAGTTKNREPRTFPLYPQLRDLLWRCADQRARRPVELHSTDRVFAPITSFAYHWRKACIAAGVPALLVHDFRRTAARNLIEAGVDRQVAMKLLGHKTESIFNRYRITTKKELASAADKLSTLLNDGPHLPSR